MIDGILFIREDDRIGVSGKWPKVSFANQRRRLELRRMESAQ